MPPASVPPASVPAECVNHPGRAAVEHCELCGRALCGECLWYSAGGRRLCQTHAARAMASGEIVQPPEMYADAVELRGAPPAATGAHGALQAPYRGNSTDIVGLLAAVLGIVTLVMCGSGSYAAYCLPFVALLLGLIALSTAREAIDPARTRLLGWIGLGSGGVFVVLAVFFMLLMTMCVVLSLLGPAISGPGAYTPIPRITPRP
jgi:hypothetical protein